MIYTNKAWELAAAEAFPEKCEKCGYSNNLIKINNEAWGNYRMADTIIVRCPECHWEKDITPLELI